MSGYTKYKRMGSRYGRLEEEQAFLLHPANPADDSENEDGSKNRLRRANFETTMEHAGFGKFHYWLLLVCGWANASDAIELLCISFLLPSAECDLKLTTSDKGWLSATSFIGMLFGGYIWGSICDVYGRKSTLIVAMFLNAFSGFASSLCQEKISFIVLRLISGLGVGGSIPIVWAYFGEFQPKSKRGAMLSCLATFWMIGNVTVAVAAWAVIPRYIGVTSGEFLYNSWRIFTLICGIPAFLVAISLFALPESPQFLASHGKPELALKVISKIYETNKGLHYTSFPIEKIEIDDGFKAGSNAYSTVGKWHLILNIFKETAFNTRRLFESSLYSVTLKMIYINFSIMFGYYGLWLWFPELFNKLNEYYKIYPDDSKTVCEIMSFEPPSNASASAISDDEFCSNPVPDSKVFINSLYISLAAAPGNLWSIVHMDKLGRKFFLVLSMVGSGCAAFLIYLVKNETGNLWVSIAFGLVSTMGFNALDCLGIELFPTQLRSTGMAVTLAFGRLGAILAQLTFGMFLDVNCAIPLILVASLMISGGITGLFLPNTTGIALD